MPVSTASDSTATPVEPSPAATSDVAGAKPATSTASAATTTPTAAPKRAAKKLSGDEGAAPDTSGSVFTGQTYVIAAVIIFGGIGYLVWRRRERSLALVATAVSRSPFTPETTPAATGARFTPELLGKLEWKRFEELVAAYYNKTGVVATRTKTGPASPVHIKISWKGEQRPFASVHCIAHPSGLVDAKSIQALCEVLAAEDIRRGYVVTSGKFSVAARDLAEEKHITLLSGDIFIEKLNALPDPARNELMKDASAGDYSTPTCPQCESKMARAPEDSSMWKCPQCGTVLPRE